jgi:selenocysteine-specific elongation factor
VRVVATAGHVDHGKSSLVLALTGQDPDRLAAEKTRGLTIDLGFAFTTLASGQELAFVDVPGHVRFLKNMLAGVGAVEAAVLVVAANEGWMPQTEEHLRILELLGVHHGLVVLTKADLVDADELELVRLDVAERLEKSALRPQSTVACDSRSGRSIDEVRTALDAALATAPLARDRGHPRLWVDRAFAAKGAGTVVTGTLAGGCFHADMEVLVLPAGRPVRIRRLESNHHVVDVADPGRRLAVNLAGIDYTEVGRGHALVAQGQWRATRVVDAALTLIGDAPLRRGRYKAYVGSGEHDVHLRPFGDGGRFGRLRLPALLPLAPGDRLVLRDAGRQETVGGAEILDVDPTGATKVAAKRLDLPPAARLLAGRPWIPVAELGPLAGVGPDEAAGLAEALAGQGRACRVGAWLVATEELQWLRHGAERLVREHHAARPLEGGLELTALAAALRLDPGRLRAVLDDDRRLAVEEGRVRLASHRPELAADLDVRRLLAALEASPFAPPAPAELGISPGLARGVVREGLAVSLDGRLYGTAALDEARRRVVGALSEHDSLSVADVRRLLDTSRRNALAILSWLDGQGITRRRGDDRVAGPRTFG